jgi:membrane fusion protein, macrolide-specific efflux system
LAWLGHAPRHTLLPVNQARRAFRWRRLMSRPRVVALVVVLVAGASVGTWMGLRSTASTPSYQLVPAITTTLSQTLSVTGTIEPAATATLSFSAQGTVTAVEVTVGQHVTDGQVLATMSSPTLQEQADQASAALAQDQATLSQDETSGASSAQIAADQASVASDQSQVDAANSALSGATLVASISGIAATVGYTAGEQLAGSGGGGGGSGGSGSGGGSGGGGSGGSGSSSPSITIVSSNDVVHANVNASVVNEIKAGDQAVIIPEGGGPPVQGTLASISLVANTSTGVAIYPVVIDVTGTPSGLFGGASAAVTIIYKQAANVLAVPTAALNPGPGGRSTVQVMVGGRQVTRTVTTGITSGGLTQVTGGLSAHEKVVVNIVRIGSGPDSGFPRGVIIGPGGGRVVFQGGGTGGAQLPGGG